MVNHTALLRALIGIGLVLTIGTAGYHLIEGWTLLESLYMTVITISTIGFKEVYDLGPKGQVFTLFIIATGMGVMTYAMIAVARIMIEGEILKILMRRRSMKALEKIKDHFVICGFGRMGSFVCHELRERHIPFVVVENRPEVQDAVVARNMLLAPGDATREDVLLSAGIARARGLVSLLDSDAANVYVVLTGRRLNPNIDIIARAGAEDAEAKLRWAGASRVISPYRIGGMRLVMGILKPKVMGFLEVAMDRKELDVELGEVQVSEKSPYVGRTLAETDIRKDLNLIIVSIIKQNGKMVFNPGPATVIDSNDTLITLGEFGNLARFEKEASGSTR